MRSVFSLHALFLSLCIALSIVPLISRAETEGDYTYTVTDGQATITDFNQYYSGELSIASTLGGYPVTGIGIEAFYLRDSLTRVTIPSSITNIGLRAFCGCFSMAAINVNGGNAAFSSAEGVLLNRSSTKLIQWPGGKTGSYAIPTSVTSIVDSAFQYCNGLTSVIIPVGVSSIGAYVFEGCIELTSVTIPDSVTSIGDSAFNKCFSLTSVTIPSSVTSLGTRAFSSCTSLTSVTIPDSVTNIGDLAFYDCPALTNAVIGTRVKSIGTGMFSFCTGLTAISIPVGVTSIGNRGFECCTGLTSVTIPDSVTSIGEDAFNYCPGLTSVTIPSSVTSIGDGAFCSCSGLTSVTLPSGVTSIGAYMFVDCAKLTSVTIPASVTTIGDSAFRSCSSLHHILFQGTPPTLHGSSVFSSTPATLYYLPAYASNWPFPFAGRPTSCWNPTVQRDAAFGFASDRFSFTVSGTPDIPVKVEAATNLTTRIWTPVTNATLTCTGSISVTDPASSSLPARFYRIVWP